MLKIAWRNVLRNKRRTLLSLIIILVGVTVLFIFNGYAAFSFRGLKIMSIRDNGNFQIATKEFWANKDSNRHLLSEAELVKINRIIASCKAVKSYSKQLGVSGILGNEKSSMVVVGNGSGSEKVDRSAFDKVYLGKGVMQRLSLKEKQTVSLMATTLDGSFNAGNLNIAGSFSTGFMEADNAYIGLSLDFVQNLLNTRGIDKIMVFLHKPEMTDGTIAWFNGELAKAGLRNIQIKNWQELSPTYNMTKTMLQTYFMFMSLIIFILIFLSILEIMSMSFFERMNEIGTIRAIGTKRSQVFAILGQEGLLIGLLGCGTGIIAGLLTALLINGANITFSAPGFSVPVMFAVDISVVHFFAPCLIVMIAIMISALYPALKASKLNIVEVLRHL